MIKCNWAVIKTDLTYDSVHCCTVTYNNDYCDCVMSFSALQITVTCMSVAYGMTSFIIFFPPVFTRSKISQILRNGNCSTCTLRLITPQDTKLGGWRVKKLVIIGKLVETIYI